MFTLWRKKLIGAAGALGAFTASPAFSQFEIPIPPFGKPPVAVVAFEEQGEDATFWLGLHLAPLHPQAKSQLNREEGVAVEHVFPNSPAATAGLKEHDIVVQVGKVPVKGPEDLTRAIAESKGKELSLKVLRAGKELDLKVTPTQRPEQLGNLELKVEGEVSEPIAKALEWLQKAPGMDREAIQLFAVRPGVMAGQFHIHTEKLPEGVSIVIEKSGNNPAKIRVKKTEGKNDQSWEVTEDKLDDLPADIRAHAQKLLGGRIDFGGGDWKEHFDKMRVRAQEAAADAASKAKAMRQRAAEKTEATSKIGVEEKLDAILKKLEEPRNEASQIEALQKELKQLRKELDELRAKKPMK